MSKEKYLLIKIPFSALIEHTEEVKAKPRIDKKVIKEPKHISAGKLTTSFSKLSKGDQFIFPSEKYGNYVFTVKRILRMRNGDEKTRRVETEYMGQRVTFAYFVLKGRAKKLVTTKRRYEKKRIN